MKFNSIKAITIIFYKELHMKKLLHLLIVYLTIIHSSFPMEVNIKDEVQNNPSSLWHLPELADNHNYSSKPNEIDLISLLGGSEGQLKYGRRLQILSNLILMYHETKSLFANILPIQKKALENASSYEKYFAVPLSEDDRERAEATTKKSSQIVFITKKNIEQHDEGVKQALFIKTLEGKAVFFQLLPFAATFDEKNRRRIDRLYARLKKSTNEEVALLVRRTHAVFYNNFIFDSLAYFTSRFLISLLTLNPDNICDPVQMLSSEELNVLYQQNSIHKINEHLKKISLDNVVHDVMPHCLWIYSMMQSWKDYLEPKESLNAEEIQSFITNFEKALRILDSSRTYYSCLYKKLMVEKKQFCSKFPKDTRANACAFFQSYLLDRVNCGRRLPEEMPSFSMNTMNDDSAEINDYIPRGAASKKKFPKKKKKGASRHRPHKKEHSEIIDEPFQDIFTTKQKKIKKATHIVYDPRVLRWFDESFVATINDVSSLVYHTLNPLIDHFLITIGHAEKVEKENRPGYYTLHSLNAEIEYTSGEKQLVKISLALDPKGICFHRGFNKISSLEKPFEINAYNQNFPSLTQETELTLKKASNKLSELITNPYYYENEFCIAMSDERLKHIIKNIVLFKPLTD